MCILSKKIFNAQGCVQTVDHETAALFASKSLQQLICLVIRTKLNVLLLITHSSAVCLVAFGMIYPACKLVFLKTALCESLRYFFLLLLFLQELTNIICHKIGRKALSAVAHGSVFVRVSSKHQHGSTHYHSSVQIAKESAVFKNCPSETKIYVLRKLIRTWQRQINP